MTAGLSAMGNREDQTQVIHAAGLKGPSSIGMLPFFNNPPEYGKHVRFEFSVADEPQIMTARLLSGEVDVAAVPVNLAAVLYNKGVGLKIAAVTGNGVIHVVSSDPGVQTLEDLRGKRIYCIAKGSNPEYILRYVLEQNGIDPEHDVTIDFSFDHAELAAQMAAGKVVTGVLPEPFVTVVGMKNPAAVPRIDLQTEFSKASGMVSSYPATALIVRESVFESHGAAIEEFLDDYAKMLSQVLSDPAATGILAQEYLGLPAQMISKALPRLNLVFDRAADRKADLQRFFEILYAYNPAAIGGKIPDENIYP